MFSFFSRETESPRQLGCVAGFEETLELNQTFRPRLPLRAKRRRVATTEAGVVKVHKIMITGGSAKNKCRW
jgi:hypothetical protein